MDGCMDTEKEGDKKERIHISGEGGSKEYKIKG